MRPERAGSGAVRAGGSGSADGGPGPVMSDDGRAVGHHRDVRSAAAQRPADPAPSAPDPAEPAESEESAESALE